MTSAWRAACAVVVAGGVLMAAGCGSEPSADTVKPKLAPRATTAKPAPKAPVAPPEPTPPVVHVHPAKATLDAGDPGLQLLADEDGPNGGVRDVTAAVAWRLEPPEAARVEASGYLRPLRPGKIKVLATRGGKMLATAAVEVRAEERAWDFGNDIVPILTRAGCNTGGCHGKADGQNGFHMSLFGYDPEADYQALTRDPAARRISQLDPDRSLFLQKATGRIPHGGAQRIAPRSPEYDTLLGWLRAGAPMTKGKTHGALTDLTVEPKDVRLSEPGPRQLRVVAHYADGHERDVTREALYRINDDTVASIDPHGKAALARRAEVDIVVRFKSTVVATRVATLINPDLKFDFAKLPRRNFVDVELFKRLESLKVPPSPPASDAAFLRRVTLDLTAGYPERPDVQEYVKDKDPKKREKVIDRLLKSKAFVDYWKVKLGDLLQISQQRFGNGNGPYQNWLSRRMAENAPWDQMVRELLTALGDPAVMDNGAANYALDGNDAKVKAEQTAQRFLALRMRCAQCHDHPFDIWTQDDYYGLAAFFAKATPGAARPGMMGRQVIKVDPKAEVEHLRTKRPAKPRLLGGKSVTVKDDEDPRKALADWMTAPENPYFARAAANWVWAQLFGKGLADPADDLSRSNPPVHPELLDALAKHFIETKYDLRELIRTVASSEAYALASATIPENQRDHRLFSHHLARPLDAYQMADAIAHVTNVPLRFGEARVVRKAIEVNEPSVRNSILDTFGRCSRTTGCSAAPTASLSLRQSLLLIGGDVIETKIADNKGYLSGILDLNMAPEEIVENLYYRTLCRPPTQEELSHWAGVLRGSSSLPEASEDLFWALLNSREFAFNH